MLADKTLQVISICSYPQDHARHAVAAAQAGKHLIIEKPLALNWESCVAIEKAVRWVLTCRNSDGGFGHFPGSTSDADANYFQTGVLVMGGLFVPPSSTASVDIYR